MGVQFAKPDRGDAIVAVARNAEAVSDEEMDEAEEVVAAEAPRAAAAASDGTDAASGQVGGLPSGDVSQVDEAVDDAPEGDE